MNLLPKLKAHRRQLLCGLLMVPVCIAIHLAAYGLRFEGQLSQAHFRTLGATLGWVVLTKLIVFALFRIYQGWSRYVTFHDLMVLCQASLASFLVLLLGDSLFSVVNHIPRSVLVLDCGITIVAIGGIRSLRRIIQERELPPFLTSGKTPVFIVGANDAGETLLRAIRRNAQLSYRVVGFIGENCRDLSSYLGGIPVVGVLDQTCKLAIEHGVSEVLLAAGELSGKQVRKLVNDCARSSVTVKVLPSFEQLLHGNVDLRPRSVSIEDLLRRDPVQLDQESMHDWIDNRVLLVTGSAGSIGSEICRQLLQFSPKKLVLLDRSENGQFFLERELRQLSPQHDLEIVVADITDGPRLRHVFDTYQPEIVFHAAAYKHVPLMESNPGEGVKNIALATRQLVDLADEYGATSFVMISTDKAVNPTSIMGTCKRVAELYVQATAHVSDCRFVTVRFGNVLDSAGSVVPIFRDQIAKGGPITVTHPDITRYFMTIPEASQLVIQAGAMGRGGEIFVLNMGEPIRIVELAEDMIRLSGLQVGEDIEIEYVGLRPGEKLFEELHVEGEEHLPTSHPKIMVAAGTRTSIHKIQQAMLRLAEISECSKDEIQAELHEIVPQYRYVESVRRSPLRKAA